MRHAVPLVLVVCLFAGSIQSGTGMGFGLFSVPLLSGALSPTDAVVLAAAIGTPLAAFVAWKQRSACDWGGAVRMGGTSVLTLPFGVVALKILSDSWLLCCIAVSVVLYIVAVRAGVRLRSTPAIQVGSGAASGVLGAATGMGGPPVIMALSAASPPAEVFRATLSVVVSLQGLAATALFVVAGLLAWPMWPYIAAGMTGALLGGFAGEALFRWLEKRAFDAAVQGVLLFTGVVAVANLVRI